MLEKINKIIKQPQKIILWANWKGYLNWLPDKAYLNIMYISRMKKKLDLNNPKTFNEKLQWLKIYDRNPKYIQMVDKYEAKKYITEKIGPDFIIPTYGVWDSFDDINIERLPDQFVLKCTHDCGGLVICRDKKTLDMESARSKINRCLQRNYFYNGREWPYKNVKPRVIAEKYMRDPSSIVLKDYKFYCFNGKPEFVQLSQGMEKHSTASMAFLNLDWERLPFERSDFLRIDKIPPKPLNFELMKTFAEELSQGHLFLRVDLYEINGRVYFSELTFSPTSGFIPIQPPEYDLQVGRLLELPKNTNIKKVL
ncbi:glycosyl transferase [Neobacillus drentensis]|uniref:ATP-grasp fold amidoligase family protein n=1 Tax=Neobacillus drentensis TaxID=220684 RepID=UPI001F36A41F|nr:ATP-grasp fold amidoligase family protein [Neobacillus drentensis]ULT56201.1 glycosyl transferase [Neobacillus drentensis]